MSPRDEGLMMRSSVMNAIAGRKRYVSWGLLGEIKRIIRGPPAPSPAPSFSRAGGRARGPSEIEPLKMDLLHRRAPRNEKLCVLLLFLKSTGWLTAHAPEPLLRLLT